MAYTRQVDSAWEAIFMLVILKIPLVYLGVVVWWAIRAAPEPGDGGDAVGVLVPLSPCGWEDWKRQRYATRRPPRPLGSPPSRVHRARAGTAT